MFLQIVGVINIFFFSRVKLFKSQITILNPPPADPMTKIQSASGGSNVLNIEYWNLEFVCYLAIVIWCFSNWSLVFNEFRFVNLSMAHEIFRFNRR
jgi:hypothetical protein